MKKEAHADYIERSAKKQQSPIEWYCVITVKKMEINTASIRLEDRISE